MRKTLSLSDNVVEKLAIHAKENNTSQSKVVEVAISLYLAMMQGAQTMAKTIEELKVPGQTDIFENLKK